MNKEDKIFNSVGFGAELAVKEAREYYNTELKEFRHHDKMRKLALNNYIDVICQNIHYIWADYIIPAQRYLCAAPCEPDENSIMAFKQLTDVLSTAFDNSVKILEIHTEGLREHGWTITFAITDFVFVLYVPNLNTADGQFEYEGQLTIRFFTKEETLSMPIMNYHILEIGQSINSTLKNNPEHWSYSDYIKYINDDDDEDCDSEDGD